MRKSWKHAGKEVHVSGLLLWAIYGRVKSKQVKKKLGSVCKEISFLWLT